MGLLRYEQLEHECVSRYENFVLTDPTTHARTDSWSGCWVGKTSAEAHLLKEKRSWERRRHLCEVRVPNAPRQ